MEAGRGEISWQSPTHEHATRTPDWYWALGVLSVCGIIACILWGNLLFAFIIAIAALSIGVLAAREPRQCAVRINERGIIVDGEHYPYESLHSFWVATHGPAPKLYLATHGILHPHISLMLYPPASPEAVHRYLSAHLEEEESHSLGSFLAEVFGL